jgi:hypothetical protein
MRMACRDWLGGVCLVAFVAACGAPVDEAAPGDEFGGEFGVVTEEIHKGTRTNARPEVGMLEFMNSAGVVTGICTGTLVAPSVVLTAAHCFDYARNRTYGSTYKGQFVMHSTAGKRLTPVALKTAHALSPTTDDSVDSTADDVGVIILTTAVAASTAVPASLRLDFPLTPGPGGTVTHMGYGCNGTPDSCGTYGDKEYRTHTAGVDDAVGLEGDSGGPVFLGELGDNGPLDSVHSGTLWELFFGYSDWDAYPLPYLEFIVAHSRASQFGFEASVDLLGSDIENTIQPDAFTCAVRCANNASCKAMSYVESSDKCYLKGALPPYRAKKGVISYVIPGRSATESGYYRTGGSELRSFRYSGDSTCAKECVKERGCDAWSIELVASSGSNRFECTLRFGRDSKPVASNPFVHASGLRGGKDYFADRGQSVADLELAFDYLFLPRGCSYLYGIPMPCVYSEDDCQSECQSQSECKYWVWRRTGRPEQCELYYVDPPATTRRNSMVVSGLSSNYEKANTTF